MLSYLILTHYLVPCTELHCTVLSCKVFSSLLLSYAVQGAALCCTLLRHVMLCLTGQDCAAMHYTVLYYTVPHCSMRLQSSALDRIDLINQHLLWRSIRLNSIRCTRSHLIHPLALPLLFFSSGLVFSCLLLALLDPLPSFILLSPLLGSSYPFLHFIP